MTYQEPKAPSPKDLDAASYRALMRHQAGAVTVIATGRLGARAGLTATAVSSLSDNPPTILACVGRKAGAHDLIAADGAFSVNVLAATQRDIAERFSGSSALHGEDRFAGLCWETLGTGAPLLVGALAGLDCRLVESHAFSTHTIFIGRVVAGRCDGGLEPLLYFRGAYRHLSEK
ncbi:MAG: flavin reductase family protein [Hyphomicrobiaceae bacterium]|nr:flavin reductase family protein [Hyphomicrobiaceae bacterium]